MNQVAAANLDAIISELDAKDVEYDILQRAQSKKIHDSQKRTICCQ